MTITAIPPIAAAAPEDDRRAAYIAGLRILASALEAHPEVPLPYNGDNSPMTIHFLHGDDDGMRAALAAAARALPCSWRKQASDGPERGYLDLHGELAGLKVMLTAYRDAVCEQVVTGTSMVTEMVPDPVLLAAVPLVPVTTPVDVVEWRCESVLAPRPGGRPAEAEDATP